MFEQDRFIVRLQQRITREEAIVACFLSGSFGRRTSDAFSDLDVGLVYTDDETRDVAWHKRFEFVKDVLPYVPAKSFDADHVRPYFHIALYSNGAKVDYRFESQTNLIPTTWDREIRILKDTGGWAQAFADRCSQTFSPPPRISREEMTRLDHRFWVMFWDIYRLLLRGDADKGFSIYLELLHFTLPPFLRILPPEDASRKALIVASYDYDTRATLAHMRSLLDAYQEARSAVIRRTNVAFIPNSGFEQAIRRLIERSG